MKDLAFDKERAGDFYVDAVTHGRQLDLKAHSEFDKLANLTIAGTVALEHDFNADLRLAFDRLDADALLQIYLPRKNYESFLFCRVILRFAARYVISAS